MQAIAVKHLRKTDRFKAYCTAGSIIVPQIGGVHYNSNVAAFALIKKLGWGGTWHRGWLHTAPSQPELAVYVCAVWSSDDPVIKNDSESDYTMGDHLYHSPAMYQ